MRSKSRIVLTTPGYRLVQSPYGAIYLEGRDGRDSMGAQKWSKVPMTSDKPSEARWAIREIGVALGKRKDRRKKKRVDSKPTNP